MVAYSSYHMIIYWLSWVQRTEVGFNPLRIQQRQGIRQNHPVLYKGQQVTTQLTGYAKPMSFKALIRAVDPDPHKKKYKDIGNNDNPDPQNN